VVISIISLLIAILLPALGSARQSAFRLSSLSNLRQIALAVTTYANDNQSSLPYVERARFVGGVWDTHYIPAQNHWPGQLTREGYLTTSKVFWAPGRSSGDIDPANPKLNASNIHEFRYSSYGGNTGAFGTGEAPHRNRLAGLPGGSILGMPLRLGETRAPAPSNMLMLVEGGHSNNTAGFSIAGARSNSNSGHGYIIYNYQGSMLRAYVDGHANALGRDTNKQLHMNAGANPALYSFAHQNDLGWELTAANNVPMVLPEDFRGWWMYANNATLGNPKDRSRPWYMTWRTSNGWSN